MAKDKPSTNQSATARSSRCRQCDTGWNFGGGYKLCLVISFLMYMALGIKIYHGHELNTVFSSSIDGALNVYPADNPASEAPAPDRARSILVRAVLISGFKKIALSFVITSPSFGSSMHR